MFMPGIWSKKKIIVIIQKEKGNIFTLLIIVIVKSLQKRKIEQIYYYDPQSAGINVQSPQSESTTRKLTLDQTFLFWNELPWPFVSFSSA